jgi:hypothetical protein
MNEKIAITSKKYLDAAMSTATKKDIPLSDMSKRVGNSAFGSALKLNNYRTERTHAKESIC